LPDGAAGGSPHGGGTCVAIVRFADEHPQALETPMSRTATLTRMVLPDHECPFGLRAKAMLEQAGFDVDERILSSREEVEAFKEERGLSTTPLVEIDGETVGGSDDLERYLATMPAD
jgi:glutaredoxin